MSHLIFSSLLANETCLVFGHVPSSFLTRCKDGLLECLPGCLHTFWNVCQHLLTEVLMKKLTFGWVFQVIYIYFILDLPP